MINLNLKKISAIFLWTILQISHTCLNAENEPMSSYKFNHNNFIAIRYDKNSHTTSTQYGEISLEINHTKKVFFDKCAYGIGLLNTAPSLLKSEKANYHVFTKNFDRFYLPGGSFFSPKKFFREVIKEDMFSSIEEFEAVIKELISQINTQCPRVYDVDKLYKYLGEKEAAWAPQEVKERLKETLRMRFFSEIDQTIAHFDTFDNLETTNSYAKFSLSKFVKSHLIKNICNNLSTEELAVINKMIEKIAQITQNYYESKINNQDESFLALWKECAKIILKLNTVLQTIPCNETSSLWSLLIFAKKNVSQRLDFMKENILTFNDIRYFQRVGFLFIPNYLKGFDSIDKQESTDAEIATVREFLIKAFYGIDLCLQKSVEPANNQNSSYYSLYFKIQNKKIKFLKFFSLIPDALQQEFWNDAEKLFEPYISKCLTNMTLFERIKIFQKKHFMKELSALGAACLTGLIIKFYPHMILQRQALKGGLSQPFKYVARVKFSILTINDFTRTLQFLLQKFDLKKLGQSPYLKNIAKQLCTGNIDLIQELCDEIELSGPSFFKFALEMKNINQKMEHNLFKILKECGKIQKHPHRIFSLFEIVYGENQTESNFENYKKAALKAFDLNADDFTNFNHASFLQWRNLGKSRKECLSAFSKQELIQAINNGLTDESVKLILSNKLSVDKRALFSTIMRMNGCLASFCKIWVLKQQILECSGDESKIKKLIENFYFNKFESTAQGEDSYNEFKTAFSGLLEENLLKHIPLWPLGKECCVCFESFSADNFRSTGCHCLDHSVCDTCANTLEVQHNRLPERQYTCPNCRGNATIPA